MAFISCMLLQTQVSMANEVSVSHQSEVESTISADLEGALKNVKAKITIPSYLTDFNYRQYNDDFHFIWDGEDCKEDIYVVCSKEGNIKSYNYYKYDNEKKLASIDANKAKEKAQAFLKQIIPEYVASLVYKNCQLPGTDSSYTVIYQLAYDNIPVYNQKVVINVNKYTGEIESFEGITFNENARYTQGTPSLTLEEAKTRYLKEAELPLSYQTYTDDDETEKAFLAYDLEHGIYAINANTGEIITTDDVYITYDQGGINYKVGATEEATTEAERALSPEEQKAIEEAKTYVSTQTIEDKLEKVFPKLKSMTLLETGISKNKDTIWRSMSYGIEEKDELISEAYVTCDAKTGELYRYSYYNMEEKTSVPGARWQAEEAKALMQTLSPEKSKVVQMEPLEEENEEAIYQQFRFNRYYNDILVEGNSIKISYNTALQEVERYAVNWDDNLAFPSSKGVLTEKALLDQVGFSLYYLQTEENQYELIYAMDEDGMYLHDAFSGQKVNWRGEIIKEYTSTDYTDIKGHPNEEIIRQLYNSGIALDTKSLKPDTAITQGEFLKLFMQAIYEYKDTVDAYEEAMSLGIISEDMKNENKNLSRIEALQYMIDATPYKKLATQAELYNYPYKDNEVAEDLKGYITLGYGLNLTAHEDAYFKPEEKLTKAEAMVMIYRFIMHVKQD